MAFRRAGLPWLVVGVLLALTMALSGSILSRAQQAPIVDSTLLVTGRVEIAVPADATVSAATITLLTGQATYRLIARGTVLLLVEAGRITLETDANLPGFVRQGEDGDAKEYQVSIGQRVTLLSGSAVTFRNDAPEPVRIFLLTIVTEREESP